MGCELAFLTQIILDEDKHIDVDIGAGEVTATIAAGTYNTIFDLIAEAETQLKILHATFTVVLNNGANLGHTTIARTGNFTIKWLTGTNTLTSLGPWLGFDITADDNGGAASFLSDNRHQFGWYDPVGPDSDSYDRKQSMGPRSFVAMSSSVSRTTYARHHIREIAFQWIPSEYFFESDAATNEAYELWWIDAAEGLPFHIFSDLDLAPGSWTDQGQYALEVDENDDLLDGVPRLAPGSPFYSFRLRMRKQE